MQAPGRPVPALSTRVFPQRLVNAVSCDLLDSSQEQSQSGAASIATRDRNRDQVAQCIPHPPVRLPARHRPFPAPSPAPAARTRHCFTVAHAPRALPAGKLGVRSPETKPLNPVHSANGRGVGEVGHGERLSEESPGEWRYPLCSAPVHAAANNVGLRFAIQRAVRRFSNAAHADARCRVQSTGKTPRPQRQTRCSGSTSETSALCSSMSRPSSCKHSRMTRWNS